MGQTWVEQKNRRVQFGEAMVTISGDDLVLLIERLTMPTDEVRMVLRSMFEGEWLPATVNVSAMVVARRTLVDLVNHLSSPELTQFIRSCIEYLTARILGDQYRAQ